LLSAIELASLTGLRVPCHRKKPHLSIRAPGASASCAILRAMTVDDFRRLALSLDGAEESSHRGAPDFRVGGKIFATLASQSQGYGNLMLAPDRQAGLVEEMPDVFVPVKGAWGKMGATHIRLDAATGDLLAGALRMAWNLRVEKNRKPGAARRARIR
jgi:hypothetical protein